MKSSRIIVLCLSYCTLFVWGWVPSLAAEKSADVLFHDSLQKAPQAPWQWIRENPETHRSGENGLEIMIEPGGLMGSGRNAKNILVRPLPKESRSVSVQVAAKHESQFEQAGLILYTDDDTYIKLVKEFVDGQPWVVFVVEIKTKPSVIAKVPCPQPQTWVGLELDGENVRTVCWGPDKKRIEIGKDKFPMKPYPRIGVFTQSGQRGAQRWARFTDFVISKNAKAVE